MRRLQIVRAEVNRATAAPPRPRLMSKTGTCNWIEVLKVATPKNALGFSNPRAVFRSTPLRRGTSERSETRSAIIAVSIANVSEKNQPHATHKGDCFARSKMAVTTATRMAPRFKATGKHEIQWPQKHCGAVRLAL